MAPEREQEKRTGLRGLFGLGAAREQAPKARAHTQAEDGAVVLEGARRPPPKSSFEQAALDAAEARVRELRRRQEEESKLPMQGNVLFQVYKQVYTMAPDLDRNGKFSLSAFMENGELPSREQRGWLVGFERRAIGLPHYSGLRPARVTEEEARRPVDATAHIRISADALSAWMFLMPPVNGGADMPVSHVLAKLAEAGVVWGVNENKIEMACRRKRYLTLIEVASGKRPRDGVDGEVIDHFKRDNAIELKEKEDSTIDYKDLGWLQTVSEGQVICDIIPPVDPQDGVSVRGQTVRGRPGKKPLIPAGQGTRYIEEQSALVAGIDGVISYSGERFRVEPLLIIRGDVDTAVGNLDVIGSILVRGDVRDGFELKATADITVEGTVENAQLYAGGNIQVASGMNGGGGGLMEAGGTVKCSFIENANVVATGKIYSETIVNAYVYSDDAIEALGGRGAIIGGSVNAKNRIEALAIGHPSNRATELGLGCSYAFILEKREMLHKRAAMVKEIEDKEANIRFLEGRENRSWPEQVQLDEQKMSVPVLKMQLGNIERHLTVMNRRGEVNRNCLLKAAVLHPPVELMMATLDVTLDRVYMRAELRVREGHIIANEVKPVEL